MAQKFVISLRNSCKPIFEFETFDGAINYAGFLNKKENYIIEQFNYTPNQDWFEVVNRWDCEGNLIEDV